MKRPLTDGDEEYRKGSHRVSCRDHFNGDRNQFINALVRDNILRALKYVLSGAKIASMNLGR
ncbi:MAG TPA: hypothetical protein DDX37_02355 [Candidatus Omnitrophica bacterium]|nr:hypothetical protein [Candidatus Omnitrophota bacterium]